MKITCTYFAQIRQQAGLESESIEVAEGATVLAALKTVEHGAAFERQLFDEDGGLRPIIMLVVNGTPALADQVLAEGDKVQVFSPVAGG